MIRVNIATWSLLVALQGLFGATAVRADDVTVIDGLKRARELFELRDPGNLQPTSDAIQILSNLEGKADDPNLNYDVLILEIRAYYWNGGHLSDNSQKLKIFLTGIAKSDAAKKINNTYAEAYYYGGVHLGRWAEIKGGFDAMGKIKEIIQNMNDANSRVTRTGKSGNSLDGSGPNRLLGRMYYKLPGILGGSREKALQYLREAIKDENASGYRSPINTVFYAEALSDGNANEKAEARRLLDELLANDPKTYNSDRVPENQEEFAEGRQLRSRI